MSGLAPLGKNLSPEARNLAEALRVQFEALEISVRQYANRCPCDPGTVSRYLNGTRIPPWPFIDGLLQHVAEHRGEPATEETLAHLGRLYRRVVINSAAAGRVQALEHLLEESEEHVRELQAQKRAMAQALQEWQQRLRNVELQVRKSEAARAVDRETYEAALAEQQKAQHQLRIDRELLKQQVTVLRRRLEQARRNTTLADERCARLQAQLTSDALAEKPRVLGWSAQPSTRGTMRTSVRGLGATRTRWAIGMVIAPIVAGVASYVLVLPSLEAESRHGRPPAADGPSHPSPDRQRGRVEQRTYTVAELGQMIDDAGQLIGEVHPGDVFTLKDTPDASRSDSGYDGTVVGKDLAGYVMQAKLIPRQATRQI